MAIASARPGVPSVGQAPVPYVDDVIRAFLIATILWGVVAFLAGVYIALQLAFPALNLGLEWTTFGRLRPVHTSAAIFAFGGSALLGTSFHVVQRTCHARLFADKLAWLDSAWDAVHTAVRPVGGALLALAVVDATDPAWQVATLLLGGGAAFASHAAKAATRAVANTSPEPVSNVALSTTEDVATGGLLWLVLANPEIAIVVAVLLAILTVVLLVVAWRVLRTIWTRWKRIVPPPGPDPFR